MNIKLDGIALSFKKGIEWIPFADVTYFYGQMGAGKSTIARLVDFCLGGELEYSPALQAEFIAAKLHLRIDEGLLFLERVRDSDLIRADWSHNEDQFSLVLPARKAAGVVIPDTPVETVSDLVFHLTGLKPPKVRKSKINEDSEVGRLSIRDLLWYCYLDQESMDSSFFNLDAEAHPFKRLKSRDVLRFLVGFHQEHVTELEVELQNIRERRLSLVASADALRNALREHGIVSKKEMDQQIEAARAELNQITDELAQLRKANVPSAVRHPSDSLRERARILTSEIESVEVGISAVAKVLSGDRRHRNEREMLTIRSGRIAAARAVLGGVEFEFCPRCTLTLPVRREFECPVCGQDEPETGAEHLAQDVLQRDAVSRIAELDDAIARHAQQSDFLKRRLLVLREEKGLTDRELNDVMRDYDSAYLASAIGQERRKATLEQRLANLQQMARLPSAADEQIRIAVELEGSEIRLRSELKSAREAAEKDTVNLRTLEDLFLDCLLRAKVPGIEDDDQVTIRSPQFLPEITSPRSGELTVVSFSNLGSGGKKTLFKCCFALAVHRLANRIGANLPRFLIIDSPMKNISERENREQFEGFHHLVYALASSELRDNQFILIDKEFLAPDPELEITVLTRHMTPMQEEHPPLITYYHGH